MMQEQKIDLDAARNSIDKCRNKLLETSARNVLLNFNIKSKSKLIRIFGTSIESVENIIKGRKPFGLDFVTPLSDAEIKARALSEDQISRIEKDAIECAKSRGYPTDLDLPLYKVITNQIVIPEKGRGGYYKIPVPYFKDELERRLKRLNDAQRTKFEEAGVKTLYLALGFLKWREANFSSKEFLAPLLSVPLEIKRIKVPGSITRREYLFEASAQEAEEINLTLKIKLQSQGFELPDFDEKERSYIKYLNSVKERVEIFNRETGGQWEVFGYGAFCCLEFFTQAMHHDLDPDSWPEGIKSMVNGTALGALYLNRNEEKESNSCSYHDIDSMPNIHQSVPLICDADPFQHDALIDAIEYGKDLIIVGPPGTGKSQTITNLIAAAIFNEKKVLFVSEKMAALQVVKRRLESAGLGEFCFDLHSNVSNKKEILNNIQKRLSFDFKGFTEDYYTDLVEHYEFQKNQLNEYDATINSEWGKTGLTVHDWLVAKARWEIKLGDVAFSIPVIKIDSSSITASERALLADELKTFIEAYTKVATLHNGDQIRDLEIHPWYGVCATNVREARVAKQVYENLCDSQRKLEYTLDQLQELERLVGKSFIFNFFDASRFKNLDSNLPSRLEKVRWNAVPLISNIGYKKSLENYIKTFDSLREYVCSLERVVKKECLRDFLESCDENIFNLFPKKKRVSVSRIKEYLAEINRSIEGIESEQSRIVNLLKEAPDSIIKSVLDKDYSKGASFFKEFVAELNKLKQTSWGSGAQLTDISGSDIVSYRKLRSSFLKARERVSGIYDLKMIPDYASVKSVVNRIKSAGFFDKFLAVMSVGEYADNKRKLISWAKESKDCLSLENLDFLVSFVEAKDEYEDGHFEEKFKGLYRGVETDPEELQNYLNWRNEVKRKYGKLPGAFSYLVSLDENSYSSVVNFSYPDQYAEACEKLKDVLSEFQISQRSSKNIEGVINFQDNLRSSIGFLDKIVVSDLVEVSELRDVAEQRKDFFSKLKLFESNEIYESCLSQYASIDLFSDESESSVDYLRSTLNLYERLHVLLNNEGALNSLLTNWTEEKYRFFVKAATSFSEAVLDFDLSFSSFKDKVELDLAQWQRNLTIGLTELYSRNQEALQSEEDLPLWANYVRALKSSEKSIIYPLIKLLLNHQISIDKLESALNYSIAISVCNVISQKYESLPRGVDQDKRQGQFRYFDKALSDKVRNCIVARQATHKGYLGVYSNKTSELTELKLLTHEIDKQKRHIPLRQLIQRAGRTLLDIKPCWMMSPFSVAQVLKPGTILFDLVVMDEASQILPEYAIGALARGKQAVIVGDPKQLPPTPFFRSVVDDSDEDESEDYDEIDRQESILEYFSSKIHKRQLNWHYRSQHESLILFSNREFYNDELVVFPSQKSEAEDLGIKFKYIENGYFVNGKNDNEAEFVAKQIIRHITLHPDESLGVVAMNNAQKECIEQFLEKYANSQDVHLDELINRPEDSLFIKNLENVQGDERDVIFISFTYGKDRDSGKVMQRFGPINQEKGWRRLNVLFTRARKRMHVFSSMRDVDILPNEASNGHKSVKALKDFLTWAQTGRLPTPVTKTGRPADSDFEIAVMEMLKDHGFECEAQVGVASFFIDVAVKDPYDPGAYLMGIECDGATYHSSRSARERDRLRQEILEQKGWKIRRVWSTDWFENPKATLSPIVVELQQLREKSRVDHSHVDKDVPDDVDMSSTFSGTDEKLSPSYVSDCGSEESYDHAESGKDETDNDLSLREQLLALRDQIDQEFPDVPLDNRLLNDKIIDALIRHKPLDREEFAETLPQALRLQIDSRQATRHLAKVFELIKEYV